VTAKRMRMCEPRRESVTDNGKELKHIHMSEVALSGNFTGSTKTLCHLYRMIQNVGFDFIILLFYTYNSHTIDTTT
jgi:hypothetical protein